MGDGRTGSIAGRAGTQERGKREIQPREMIINEPPSSLSFYPLPTTFSPCRSSSSPRNGRNSLGGGDKVRRIEDDVKNKRSVFTTVWNWTASPREKWGSPTAAEKMILCVTRLYREDATRQCDAAARSLTSIYSAEDAGLCHLVFIVRGSLVDQQRA